MCMLLFLVDPRCMLQCCRRVDPMSLQFLGGGARMGAEGAGAQGLVGFGGSVFWVQVWVPIARPFTKGLAGLLAGVVHPRRAMRLTRIPSLPPSCTCHQLPAQQSHWHRSPSTAGGAGGSRGCGAAAGRRGAAGREAGTAGGRRHRRPRLLRRRRWRGAAAGGRGCGGSGSGRSRAFQAAVRVPAAVGGEVAA